MLTSNPPSEIEQSRSDGTRLVGNNCWPTAVGGGGGGVHRQWEFMGGFIADLSYVNFVPLGDFLDINGDKKIWAPLLVGLKLIYFCLENKSF